VGYFCHFQKNVHSKQTPVGQKFNQSGHPGCNREMNGSCDLRGPPRLRALHFQQKKERARARALRTKKLARSTKRGRYFLLRPTRREDVYDRFERIDRSRKTKTKVQHTTTVFVGKKQWTRKHIICYLGSTFRRRYIPDG
jgi:hypothetical protein